MGQFHTFREWQASGVRMEPQAARDLLGLEDIEAELTVAIWVYDGQTWIEELSDGFFYLILGQDETLCAFREAVERKLFYGWYVSECQHDWTRAQLMALKEEGFGRGIGICADWFKRAMEAVE